DDGHALSQPPLPLSVLQHEPRDAVLDAAAGIEPFQFGKHPDARLGTAGRKLDQRRAANAAKQWISGRGPDHSLNTLAVRGRREVTVSSVPRTPGGPSPVVSPSPV